MITPTILRALLEENSVMITGLGTFSVRKLPSTIKDDIVYPPQNIIEFEYSKDIEGFDFVSKLSKWEQIRIDEAQARISEWLNLLEQGLEHNKSLFFDDFGTFSKEPSGKIRFQSMLVSQLNIENEGLEPVYILSQKREQKPPIMEEPVVDKRVALVQKSKKRDKFWFWTTILATIILLIALFFKDTFIQWVQSNSVKNETTTLIEDDDIDTTAFITGIEDNISPVIVAENSKIGEYKNHTTSNLSKSNDVYLPYQADKYYVIAGSFTKEEDALRHIKQKKLEKYHAKIIVQPNNPRKRVCVGVFDNEKDAISFATQIDKNYWVLK